MNNARLYNVNGVFKNSLQLTYDDLVWIFNDFGEKHGCFSGKDIDIYDSLPSRDIIRRIIKSKNMNIVDFYNTFNTYQKYHKKYLIDKYDDYVKKYMELSNKINRSLTREELKYYNLPGTNWFVKYCPMDNVLTWDDFTRQCGFLPKKVGKGNIKSKKIIKEKLISYEKEIGRPIKTSDITVDSVGFSYDIVLKIWGGLKKCKEEIGLLPTCKSVRNWEYYKEQIKIALDNVYKHTHCRDISWSDYDRFKGIKLDRHTIVRVCQRENVCISDYFKNCGYNLIYSNGFGNVIRLNNGELCTSSLEQKYSMFLIENNIKYKRNIKYSEIDNKLQNKKINCDYVINNTYWIEICGIIKGTEYDWKKCQTFSEIEKDYQNKMIYKEKMLNRNSIPHLFLFKEDFDSDAYKTKTINLIHS